jgi:glycosyltransferase 2 family protein
MKFSKYIKVSLSILLVVLFIWFFYKEFKENWESVRTLQLVMNWKYLVLGIFMMIANYLCTTLSWHIGINYFDNHKKLKFAQSIALVNISQLGKYIPGKLWSYMVQIYWLASKGVPKTTVLYLNVVTTLLPILVSLLIGCLLLMMLPDWSHLRTEILILIGLLLAINLVLFNKNILRFFIEIFSRITKQKVSFHQLSTCRIISMQLLYITGAVFWVLAGCLISLSIGFGLDSLRIIFISSAMLLGDVIGFLILIAPGGLGVREGTMYLILKGTGIIQFALIFPIVMRLLCIVTDLIMGIVSVLIISRSKYFSRNNNWQLFH